MLLKRLVYLRLATLRHLREAGENYWQHFQFTAKMAWEICVTAFFLIAHGLIPGCHTRTASRRVEAIHRVLQQRIIRGLRNKNISA